MKTINIGFSRSSGKFPIFSWLIMLCQWTKYSHTYLKFHSDSINRDIVFQASGLKVNFLGYDAFLQKEIVYKEFQLEVSNETYTKILQFALDRVGQPYSLLQILNSAIYMLCRKHPFDNQIAGWDCSKLMAVLLENNLNYKINENLDVITPKDLYNYLENRE